LNKSGKCLWNLVNGPDKSGCGKKKNQVDKLTFILKSFYFLLEYRMSYYKKGCNMVILTKPKCSNLERFQECAKKTKFQECAEIYPTGQTGIAR
jgi:hypothetical protein